MLLRPASGEKQPVFDSIALKNFWKPPQSTNVFTFLLLITLQTLEHVDSLQQISRVVTLLKGLVYFGRPTGHLNRNHLLSTVIIQRKRVLLEITVQLAGNSVAA